MPRLLMVALLLSACSARSSVAPADDEVVTETKDLEPEPEVPAEPVEPPPPEVGDAFVVCEGTTRIGQTQAIAGKRCEDVCGHFGFQTCLRRVEQADEQPCQAEGAVAGACDQPFEKGSMNECVCATGE